MTLVNAETGELVDIADETEATRLAAEISAAIAHMNARMGQALDAMIEGYNAKIWVSLGYGSWGDLVEAKHWVWKPTTSTERVAIGEYLRDHNLSFKAIAKLTASSPKTIRRDQVGAYDSDRGVPNGTPHATPEITEADEDAAFESGEDDAGFEPVESDEEPSVEGERDAVDVEPSPSGEVGGGTAYPTPTSSDIAAHSEPGEVTGVTLPSNPVTSPALDEPSDAAKYAQSWLTAVNIPSFDVELLISAADACPDKGIDESVERFAARATEFAEKYRKARNARRFTVIAGGQS